MRYVPVVNQEGRKIDSKHPTDCQRLVAEGLAEWGIDENGTRYIRLLGDL